MACRRKNNIVLTSMRCHAVAKQRRINVNAMTCRRKTNVVTPSIRHYAVAKQRRINANAISCRQTTSYQRQCDVMSPKNSVVSTSMQRHDVALTLIRRCFKCVLVGIYVKCTYTFILIWWTIFLVYDLNPFKVRKTTQIRNQYNQVPHSPRIPNGKVTKSP